MVSKLQDSVTLHNALNTYWFLPTWGNDMDINVSSNRNSVKTWIISHHLACYHNNQEFTDLQITIFLASFCDIMWTWFHKIMQNLTTEMKCNAFVCPLHYHYFPKSITSQKRWTDIGKFSFWVLKRSLLQNSTISFQEIHTQLLSKSLTTTVCTSSPSKNRIWQS